ncbi:hypothetical protein I4U23_016696 [Adineta vaga]|nr:hypothetical protein I4U23_016696 [Adineta vaga]
MRLSFQRTGILSNLFARIDAVYLDDEYNKRSKYIIPPIYFVITCIFLPFLISRFPIEIYNQLNGPFHLNLDQFTSHLIHFNQHEYDEISLQIGSWPFQQEYFQIELGEDQIDQDSSHILRESTSPFSYFKTSYTMKAAKNDDIYHALYPNRLYIKLASRGEKHFYHRHPYRFHLFTMKTLRCIVRQFDILSTSYMKWNDKEIFVKKIEEIYEQNSTIFNMKVITKCGILIGYLYRPQDSIVFMSGWNVSHLFHDLDIGLDTASSYFSYTIYFCICLLFTCNSIKILCNLIIYYYKIYRKRMLVIPNQVKDQFDLLRYDTLQKLDETIVNIPMDRCYMNRLFIIKDKYLLIFMIDPNECDTNILLNFYDNSPIIVIPIENIDMINSLGIGFSYRLDRHLLSFPLPYFSDDNISNWLYQTIINIDEKYQYR